jgi:MoaD family protein
VEERAFTAPPQPTGPIMRIKVKGFLTIKKVLGDQAVVEVETETATLRSLLKELVQRYGKGFEDLIFDPRTREIMDHNQILVNGRHYRFVPDRMDAALKDGDVVALIPPVTGG